MTYTLYYSPGACSMAAHILLEELGVDFDLKLVSTADGSTGQPAYLAVNPKGRVPALAIPGEAQVLTELPAILVYLARRHGEALQLDLGDPLSEARILEWLAWLAGWVHGMGYGLLWRPGRFGGEAMHSGLTERGREIIEAAFSDIEAKLADGGPWAASDRYTLVDPFLLVLYRWGLRIGLPMEARHPTWAEATSRMAQRPAVQTVLKREGIALAA